MVSDNNKRQVIQKHDGKVQNYKGIKSDFGFTYSQAITKQTDARHTSCTADPKY